MASEDPVAPRSAFLCHYMSNHPDTLVAYAAHFGKLTSKVSSAKMESIDSQVLLRATGISRPFDQHPRFQGMTLSYFLLNGKPGGSVRVAFDPPLLSYDEVRSASPVVLASHMQQPGPTATNCYETRRRGSTWNGGSISSCTRPPTQTAMQAKRPQITTYYIPPKAAITVFLITGLILTTYPPKQLEPLADSVKSAIGGDFTMKLIWGVVWFLHTSEALYATYLCARHRTGLVIGVCSSYRDLLRRVLITPCSLLGSPRSSYAAFRF